MFKIMLAIGLMSGTSCDGVDASLIETDGEMKYKAIADIYLPYPLDFQQRLKETIKVGSRLSLDQYCDLEQKLTAYHIEAIGKLLEISSDKGVDITKLEVIGFHGQTIYHDPFSRHTLQIGNPHMIAVRFGVKVVSDFRRRDVACGGEGAPLVPVFHRCMMNKRDKPVAVLNIGGVANITYIGFRETLIAFDTGPGNALINDATLEHYALPYDESGNIAAQGNPDHLAVDHILEDAFFKRPPPKSLDRNYFYKYLYLLDQTNPQDKIATLTNLTARSIIRSISSLPQIPKEILVCGGGVKNLTLMNQLNIGGLGAIFKPLGINKNNGESCDTDFIESRAFAYLAVRLIYDMDSTFSSTTGTSIPKSAGVVYDL